MNNLIYLFFLNWKKKLLKKIILWVIWKITSTKITQNIPYQIFVLFHGWCVWYPCHLGNWFPVGIISYARWCQDHVVLTTQIPDNNHSFGKKIIKIIHESTWIQRNKWAFGNFVICLYSDNRVYSSPVYVPPAMRAGFVGWKAVHIRQLDTSNAVSGLFSSKFLLSKFHVHSDVLWVHQSSWSYLP